MENSNESAGLMEIKVGSRLTVSVKPLNGAESRKAGFMARPGDDVDQARCRALYAVRKINDEVFPPPKNDGDIDRVASRFTEAELDGFMVFYADATNNPEIDEDVKKLVALRQQSSP